MSPITWISAEPVRHEYITIDSQQRLYLSAAACELLGVPKTGHFELIVGYDLVNKRLALAKPDVVRVTDVRPFRFDGRRYAHSARFVSDAEIPAAELPQRYEYTGRDYAEYPDGAYAFQLADFDAPDDVGRS